MSSIMPYNRPHPRRHPLHPIKMNRVRKTPTLTAKELPDFIKDHLGELNIDKTVNEMERKLRIDSSPKAKVRMPTKEVQAQKRVIRYKEILINSLGIPHFVDDSNKLKLIVAKGHIDPETFTEIETLKNEAHECAEWLKKMGCQSRELKDLEKVIIPLEKFAIKDMERTLAEELDKTKKFLKEVEGLEHFSQEDMDFINGIDEKCENMIKAFSIQGFSSKKLEELKKLHHNVVQPLLDKVMLSVILEDMPSFEQILDGVLAKPDLSREELTRVFTLDKIVQSYLDRLGPFSEEDEAKMQKLKNLSQNKVVPLLSKAKKMIKTRPMEFSVEAAKEKGSAATKAFSSLSPLSQEKVLKPKGGSQQTVFVRPKEGVVLKKSEPKAKEEEHLIESLMNMMAKDAVVSSFHIKKMVPERFGISPMDKQTELRGYAFSKTPINAHQQILRELSGKDRAFYDEHFSKFPVDPDPQSGILDPSQLNTNAAYANYKKCQSAEWLIDDKIYGFNEMQELIEEYGAKKVLDLVKPVSPTSPSKGDLGNALNIEWSEQHEHVYFVPDITDPDEEKAFKKCEATTWHYDHDGLHETIDFKKVRELHLEKGDIVLDHISPQRKAKPDPDPVTEADFDLATEVGWKIQTPVIFHEVTHGEEVVVSDVDAKTFVNMKLIEDVHINYPKAVNTILKHLTPESELIAIKTGELQMLDLHANNVGLAPVPNEQYERLKNQTFKISTPPNFREVSFEDLHMEFLNGAINKRTEFIEADGSTKTIKDLPELKAALETPWKLVLFDLDLALSEDNELQWQTFKNVKGHLVPYRSCLLEFQSQAKPISKESLEKLSHSDKADQEIMKWAKNEDAPIYKHLSLLGKQKVQDLLKPILKNYSLSDLRSNKKGETIGDLRRIFVKDICADDPKNTPFWEMLEKELSIVDTFPKATWEKIAKRYHQDVEELKRMNPGIDLSQPGTKVKIKYSLVGADPALNKKRHEIARQLFPRLTVRQQDALNERMTKRAEYIKLYQALKASQKQGDDLLLELQNFARSPYCPLSRQDRNTVLNLQVQAHYPPDRIQALHQDLLKNSAPNYANFMRVMYPLLGDVFDLNLLMFEARQPGTGIQTAGKYVGHYEYTIEQTLSDAKVQFVNSPPNSIEQILIKSIEDALANKRDPAFFGSFD